MKTAVLYYFSGTGNTEMIARLLKAAFERRDYSVDLVRIEDVLNKKLPIDIQKYDLVGMGSQVIGYGAPGIVHDFIHALPQGAGQKVFIFRTCGGVAPINYNVSKAIMRKLARKGYEVTYERLFSIGSNWVVKFGDSVVRQLYDAAIRKTDLMVQEVLEGKKHFYQTGLGLRVLMETVAFLSGGFFRLVGQDYIVDPVCSHCGLCIRNCPVKNVYEKNGKVRFKLNCNSCLRCLYACPKKAIRFRFLTFFQVSGGYNIKKTLQTSEKAGQPIEGKVPPFFNNYISNDAL